MRPLCLTISEDALAGNTWPLQHNRTAFIASQRVRTLRLSMGARAPWALWYHCASVLVSHFIAACVARRHKVFFYLQPLCRFILNHSNPFLYCKHIKTCRDYTFCFVLQVHFILSFDFKVSPLCFFLTHCDDHPIWRLVRTAFIFGAVSYVCSQLQAVIRVGYIYI